MQVCDLVPDVVEMEEVSDFFESVWAPEVVQLHTPGRRTLAVFLGDLCSELEKAQLPEV